MNQETLEQYESRFRNTCELGDVYEKKKRLTKLALELEHWRVEEDTGSGTLCHMIDGILERVYYASERCSELLGERDCGEEGEGEGGKQLRQQEEEVVGDIDELLGGLSLGGKEPSHHQRQIHVRPGRRYKKVVRKNPGNVGNGVALVPAQLGDAGSDADDHVPEKDEDVAVSSDDEEKRRYAMHPTNKQYKLKVDIPVSTDVLVRAAASAVEGNTSLASSGASTKACGIPLTSTTDEYDSDGSITSPAIPAVVPSFSNNNPRR